ncbi:hypothetical protein QBC44DRAFT_397830 [Cladorrhinum sp. PSN332]|nr:hypothetical protein QBC44DRAFT_397830 [Cladorrhinum sp. PSN332]
MLSSLPAPGGLDAAGKAGKYELPFRRGSDDDSGLNEDANRVRRGGQLGAGSAAGVAPFARLPARFNTASRAVAAATWRPKEPRLSVLPTGSPISAAGPGAGFPSGAGFGGFDRVPPSSPRGGLGLAGGFVSAGGCGPIPATPRGQQAGVRRVGIAVPDHAVGYCFVRPNGTRTRLIPADLLPFSLQGIPAIETDNPNLVELPVPVGMGPDGKNTNTMRLASSTPQRGRNADAIQQASYGNSPRSIVTSSPHAPAGPGAQPKRTKIYCDKWVHEGVCAFTQQGCKYKHEMPMDKATQFSLGLFHGLPTWWKKSQAELSAPQNAPSAEENYPIARGTTRNQPQQQYQQHTQSPIHNTFGAAPTRLPNNGSSGFSNGWQSMNNQVGVSPGPGAPGSKFFSVSHASSVWWRNDLGPTGGRVPFLLVPSPVIFQRSCFPPPKTPSPGRYRPYKPGRARPVPKVPSPSSVGCTTPSPLITASAGREGKGKQKEEGEYMTPSPRETAPEPVSVEEAGAISPPASIETQVFPLDATPSPAPAPAHAAAPAPAEPPSPSGEVIVYRPLLRPRRGAGPARLANTSSYSTTSDFGPVGSSRPLPPQPQPPSLPLSMMMMTMMPSPVGSGGGCVASVLPPGATAGARLISSENGSGNGREESGGGGGGGGGVRIGLS